MPTYEYRCPNGHEFEKFFRKISDATGEMPCPECGVIAERQLSGGAGLVFKGSGFYLTDYGKNAHRKAAPASDAKSGEKSGDKGADKGGDKGGEKPAESAPKSETKSETKSESKSSGESASGTSSTKKTE